MKRFLIYSVILHAVLVAAVYFIPADTVKRGREFVARLVTPEELQKESRAPRKPLPVPLPAAPPKVPLQPTTKIPSPGELPSRPLPPPDEPLVPGEGKETGEPLPEGMRPAPGDGGREGETGISVTPDSGKAGGKRSQIPLRDRLFDRTVTDRIAGRDAGLAGKKKKDNGITFQTKDYRYAGYMRNLKMKIESIWAYPPEAAEKGLYGDLKIRFTIRKDGRLESIELVRTSGYKLLDDAALKALKDGEPYWPLPDEWGMESYSILGHFVYSLYGYYLR